MIIRIFRRGHNMEKCCRCEKIFNVSDARKEYNAEFGEDLDFDENYGNEVCADCAICDTESNINLGKAIDMMNGEEDYDADHVEKYL